MDERTLKRFWSKVNKSGPIPVHCPELGPCWVWTANKSHGYGLLKLNRTCRSAHRLAWESLRGPIPAGIMACHRCDNRACVNPDHLFLGTAVDNMQDMLSKGRERRLFGSEHQNSRFSDQQIGEMRALFADGFKQSDIADRFGASRQLVSSVVNNKRRVHGTRENLPPPKSQSESLELEQDCTIPTRSPC